MSDKRASKTDRLKSILRGAFAGPPTPLKDIPTKEGESRSLRKVKRSRSKKRA